MICRTTPPHTQKRRPVRSSFNLLRSSEDSSFSLPSLYTDTISSSTLHRSYSGRSSGRKPSSRLSIGSVVSVVPSSNGIGDTTFGNLADELDGQYSYGDQEQEEAVYDDTDDVFLESHEKNSATDMLATYSPVSSRQYRYSTPVQSPTKSYHGGRPASLSPSKQWFSFSLRKPKPESLYDGSDYGPSSADEDTSEPTATPMLQRRIHDFEEVMRISDTTDNRLDKEDVIVRTTKRLKEELGDQSVVESGTSRLAVGYISMTTHRTHQSREVQMLVHKLVGAGGYGNPYNSLTDLPPDLLDTITTEINLLLDTIISPHLDLASHLQNPLLSLQNLYTSTADLLHHLHNLQDTLTESKQTLTLAARKLRSLQDLVHDLAVQESAVQAGSLAIQTGDWDRKCRDRAAGVICKELIEGAQIQCRAFEQETGVFA